MSILDCPQCGTRADRVGRMVLWYESYDFTSYEDDDDDDVAITINEERDSDCNGPTGDTYLHCPNNHDWVIPSEMVDG